MTQPNPFQQQLNYAASSAKQALEIAQGNKATTDAILALLKQTTVERSGKAYGGPPNLQYIENLPGRRVPFDVVVTIPIGSGVTSVQQQSTQISQEGPFVAEGRFAIFLSQFELQRIDPVTSARANFFGRSHGRFRPPHSAWDLMDGMPRQQVLQAEAFPGTGAPHVLSPSNGSPFRTMQPDFTVQFLNAGSSFPRSNIMVPSAWWTDQINSRFDLAALDVFERGEVLQFNVLPLHANNPSYGNIQSFSTVNPNFPFLGSGFDYLEGINDQANADAATTDPVTRLANGILYIGFHGYRIVQPAGAGPY
jgi:hypothetical protein